MTSRVQAESKSIHVFLVDDHEMVRVGLKIMLSHYEDLCIDGEAATGEEALRLVPAQKPDVVLLDLQLPDMPGLEVLTGLQIRAPESAVLVLTVYGDDDLVVSAARNGARGYVLKHTSHENLAQAIRCVATGGHYFEPDVVGALIQGYRRVEDQAGLTTRETEVLRLLAAGLSNREIGERLYLSSDTVKSHLRNIYRKLGVEGRTQAVVVALRNNLLEE